MEAVAPVCTGDVFQLYAYGAVPPVTETVAEPFTPAKQETFVCAEMDALSEADGPLIVTLAVAVQPFASVTVAT